MRLMKVINQEAITFFLDKNEGGYRLGMHAQFTIESFFFIVFHTFIFQLLDKPWSQVSYLLPPGPRLQLLSRIGFSNPTVRRIFIE